VKLFWRSGPRSAAPAPIERATSSPARPPAIPSERPRPLAPRPLPSEEALSELTAELATPLYRLAPTLQLGEGQELEVGRDRGTVSFLVSGGSVEVGSVVEGRWTALATLDKGSCFRFGASKDPEEIDVAIRAVGRSTLLELGGAVLQEASPEARAAVALRSAATASSCTRALLVRLQQAQGATSEVSRALASLRERRRAAVERAEIGEALGKMPKLPVHATELMQRLLAPGARTNEIADLIRKDPPLASLVLKTVNSPYFGLRTKVADCYRALLLLGVNQIYQMVLDSGVRSALPATPEVEAIQTHSYVVSLLAHDLAVAAGVAPQVAATVGLLHDLGKVVAPQLASSCPTVAPYVGLLDEARLGAELLRKWGVPEEVAAVIDRQQEPELAPPEDVPEPLRRELSVLHVAHVCAERISGPNPNAAPAPWLDRHLRALGRSERSAEEILAGWLRPALLKQARTLPRAVRALLGIADPGHDQDDDSDGEPSATE
jgi:putative nucleotidyltransferase with HDIG domain